MARKSGKKVRKPAPKAKRAAKSKPLVAASGSVRHGPRRTRPSKEVLTLAPVAVAFSMTDTMRRLSIANVEHAARLAACRTPVEFWLERMRFGQSLLAQWQSSVRSALSQPDIE